jgi:hypothetical protein
MDSSTIPPRSPSIQFSIISISQLLKRGHGFCGVHKNGTVSILSSLKNILAGPTNKLFSLKIAGNVKLSKYGL